MCSFMVAYHNCNHYYEWFARCSIAKERQAQVCGMTSFPTWRYPEQFPCQACRQKRSQEIATLLSGHKLRDDEGAARAMPDDSVYPLLEAQYGGKPRNAQLSVTCVELDQGVLTMGASGAGHPPGFTSRGASHLGGDHNSPHPTVAGYEPLPSHVFANAASH